MICRRLPADIREKDCSRLRRGKPFTSSNWYAYPAGRVCSHLRWGESYNRLNQHGSPPGRSFYSCKRNQNTLGLCPKTPVAGCTGYGLISGGSRKSIRTAHRIAPKVATGVSALSPHPLSRWRERGSDGRASAGRQFSARGVRACKNRKPPTLKYLFSRPIVPLL